MAKPTGLLVLKTAFRGLPSQRPIQFQYERNIELSLKFGIPKVTKTSLY